MNEFYKNIEECIKDYKIKMDSMRCIDKEKYKKMKEHDNHSISMYGEMKNISKDYFDKISKVRF